MKIHKLKLSNNLLKSSISKSPISIFSTSFKLPYICHSQFTNFSTTSFQLASQMSSFDSDFDLDLDLENDLIDSPIIKHITNNNNNTTENNQQLKREPVLPFTRTKFDSNQTQLLTYNNKFQITFDFLNSFKNYLSNNNSTREKINDVLFELIKHYDKSNNITRSQSKIIQETNVLKQETQYSSLLSSPLPSPSPQRAFLNNSPINNNDNDNDNKIPLKLEEKSNLNKLFSSSLPIEFQSKRSNDFDKNSDNDNDNKENEDIIVNLFSSQSITSTSNTIIHNKTMLNSTKRPFIDPLMHNNDNDNVKRQQVSSRNFSTCSKWMALTQRNAGIHQQQQDNNKTGDQDSPNVHISLNRPKDAILLSPEQEHVLHLVLKGKSIFYTGSAGTGKSLLLRVIIKSLREKYSKGEVAVTASTGLAACNIGGQTLNSFTGIGLGNGTAQTLLKKVRRTKISKKRWQTVKVLIIDEISMIDGKLLEKLDFIGKSIRRNDLPFGGIQLIFCGDFFQLPPVNKNDEDSTVLCFETPIWKKAVDYEINLKTIFRQKSDRTFIKMLSEVRKGIISKETRDEFKFLERPLLSSHGIMPAELYSTRNEVDNSNQSRLNQLPSKAREFNSIDGGSITDKEIRDKLLSNFLVPEKLVLKKGAQVMMLKNMDESIVNGTIGSVIDFIDPDTYMTYKKLQAHSEDYNNYQSTKDLDKFIFDVMQDSGSKKTFNNPAAKNNPNVSQPADIISNALANELDDSIFDFLFKASDKQKLEKIQKGNTSIEVESNDNHVSIEDATIDSFIAFSSQEAKESSLSNEQLCEISLERKRELIRTLQAMSRGNRYPLVRFNLIDGTTRDILVEPEVFSIEDENSKPLASRTQIPLILAWSLSIHKSQGQTLNFVKVDLKRIFTKGQAYVALSRATSRAGLQVLNFDASKITPNEKVEQYYQTLISAFDAAALEDDAGPYIESNSRSRSNSVKPTNDQPKTRGRQKTEPRGGISNFFTKPTTASTSAKAETLHPIIATTTLNTTTTTTLHPPNNMDADNEAIEPLSPIEDDLSSFPPVGSSPVSASKSKKSRLGNDHLTRDKDQMEAFDDIFGL